MLWYEWVWTLIGTVGLGVAAHALNTAWDDRQFLRLTGTNGPRQLVSNASLRREALRATTQLLFVAAGIVALVTEPAPLPDQHAAGRGVIVGLLLVAMSLIVANSTLDVLHRRKLLRALDKEGW